MPASVVIVRVGETSPGGECRCLYNQTDKPILMSLPGAGVTLISPYEAVKVFTSDPSSLVPPEGVVLAPCSSPGPWQERCRSTARVFDWRLETPTGSFVPVHTTTQLFFVGPGDNGDGTWDLTSVQLYSGATPLGSKVPLTGQITGLQAFYSPLLDKIIALSKQAGNDSDGVRVLAFNLDGTLSGEGIIPFYGMGSAVVFGDRLLVAYNDSPTRLARVMSFSIPSLIGSGDAGTEFFGTDTGYIYPNLTVQREGTVDYLYIPVLQNGATGLAPSAYKVRYSDRTNVRVVELDELERSGVYADVINRTNAWNFFENYRYFFAINGYFGAIVFQGPGFSKFAKTTRGLDSNWSVMDLEPPGSGVDSFEVRSLGVSPLTGTAAMFVVETRGSSKVPCVYHVDMRTSSIVRECED